MIVTHEIRRDARGSWVICTVTDERGQEYVGAARITSTGEQSARDRAEVQAKEVRRGIAE